MTFWKRRNVVLCFVIFYCRFLLSNALPNLYLFESVIPFFNKAKKNPFSTDRLLEPVGCLTGKIAIKGKNREICNISFFQLKWDKQSLRFKLLFNI